MERDGGREHNEMSQQEKTGIGYGWLTLLGIFGCLVIFLVIYLLIT